MSSLSSAAISMSQTPRSSRETDGRRIAGCRENILERPPGTDESKVQREPKAREEADSP